MKILTSNPKNLLPVGWWPFEIVNVINAGESCPGAVHASADDPRLFPERYGPSLGAMLDMSEGPTLLTNADIELDVQIADLDRFSEGLAFARRIEMPSGLLNPWSIDVMIFGDRFRDVLSQSRGWRAFQFSAPWSDYLLPMAAIQAGLPVWQITSPIAFHESHEPRWGGEERRAMTPAALHYLREIGWPLKPGGGELYDLGTYCYLDIMSAAQRVTINPTPVAQLAWRYATEISQISVLVETDFQSISWPRRMERALRPYVTAAFGHGRK